MNTWAKHSAGIYLKTFFMVLATMVVLGISFDVASELDHWSGNSLSSNVYRLLSVLLIFYPIGLWVSLLICVIRWQWSNEILLLRTYNIPLRKCCMGLYVSFFLLVVAWFGIKEFFWMQLNVDQSQDKQVLLQPLEDGQALLTRNQAKEIDQVWVTQGSKEGQYVNLFFLEGKGWRLKEDLRMNNAKLKAEFEKLFDRVFPSELHLKVAFGEMSSLSLAQLSNLKMKKTNWHLWMVRFGLPLMACLFLILATNKVFFQSGRAMWFNWSAYFIGFVVLVGLTQRAFG